MARILWLTIRRPCHWLWLAAFWRADLAIRDDLRRLRAENLDLKQELRMRAEECDVLTLCKEMAADVIARDRERVGAEMALTEMRRERALNDPVFSGGESP